MTYRMLLPTDGDVGMEEAIRHTIDLAQVYDATVHALYIVDENIYSAYSGDEFVEEHEGPESTLEHEGEEALAEIVDQAEDAGVDVVTKLRYGQPAEEIVEEADEINADSIILGSRTMPDEYRDRVGSVADKVLQQTDRPATVVKTAVTVQ